ncbi:MAG: response regulator [Alphaproteobacteria bacterium]|nr:response regulator [Alphaproteobacteria bacterium]
MKLSDQVVPHLPYLRRFARALTGSQQAGDAYVTAVLESVIADPAAFTAATDKRLSLYQSLCTMWSSVPVNHQPETADSVWDATIQERLSNLPGRARQVYLLKAVEGFDFHQIADIQCTSLEEVMHLYDSASQQISSMMASDVLIIEDEPLIAIDIEDVVTALGHRPIGVARTHKEALAMVRDRKPQLILSDIHLADGSSGIDAVNELIRQYDVPVIFITAFPERLLTGQRPEPAFLITKPFSPDMVKGLIAQALFFEVNSRKAA